MNLTVSRMSWYILSCSKVEFVTAEFVWGLVFLFYQAQSKQDDEFCSIWQSLQSSGKSHHIQQNMHEKVCIETFNRPLHSKYEGT